jgi:hypothetical protein
LLTHFLQLNKRLIKAGKCDTFPGNVPFRCYFPMHSLTYVESPNQDPVKLAESSISPPDTTGNPIIIAVQPAILYAGKCAQLQSNTDFLYEEG